MRWPGIGAWVPERRASSSTACPPGGSGVHGHAYHLRDRHRYRCRNRARCGPGQAVSRAGRGLPARAARAEKVSGVAERFCFCWARRGRPRRGRSSACGACWGTADPSARLRLARVGSATAGRRPRPSTAPAVPSTVATSTGKGAGVAGTCRFSALEQRRSMRPDRIAATRSSFQPASGRASTSSLHSAMTSTTGVAVVRLPLTPAAGSSVVVAG